MLRRGPRPSGLIDTSTFQRSAMVRPVSSFINDKFSLDNYHLQLYSYCHFGPPLSQACYLSVEETKSETIWTTDGFELEGMTKCPQRLAGCDLVFTIMVLSRVTTAQRFDYLQGGMMSKLTWLLVLGLVTLAAVGIQSVMFVPALNA